MAETKTQENEVSAQDTVTRQIFSAAEKENAELINLKNEVSGLRDEETGGHTLVRTIKESEFQTLDMLLAAIDERPLKFSYKPNGKNVIVPINADILSKEEKEGINVKHKGLFHQYGIMPLFKRDIGQDGSKWVFGLRTHTEGKSRSLDEIAVNLGEAIVNFQNLLPPYLPLPLSSIELLLLPEPAYNKFAEFSIHGDKRARYLNNFGNERSAREILIRILKRAVQDNASDVHISPIPLMPGETPVRSENDSKELSEVARNIKYSIRFRIDGELQQLKGAVPNSVVGKLVNTIKTMAKMKDYDRRLPQSGAIHLERTMVEQEPILGDYNFRVETIPTVHQEEYAVLRLHKKNKKFSLEQLGYPHDEYQKILKNINAPDGLILVTGPTGSGKTTTLYSILEQLNKPNVNLLSVENPVEVQIPGINQVQTNVEIGLTFQSALRSFLRLDPDIILVGEIRDKETAEVALDAAKTGHLVFSTLHTNDTILSLLRLFSIGAEAGDLQSTLQAILAQRLVRKLCPSCKERYDGQKDLNELFEEEILTGPFDLYRPGARKEKGCLDCKDYGFWGRAPIVEIWQPTIADKKLIYQGITDREIYRQSALKNGMKPLALAGLEKVLIGVTTIPEMLTAVPADQLVEYRTAMVDMVKARVVQVTKK